MGNNNIDFISEIFYTGDNQFGFQKVGCYYNLYTKGKSWNFDRSFRSFKAMQDYINAVRG